MNPEDSAFFAAFYFNFGIGFIVFILFCFLRNSESFVSTYSPMCRGPNAIEQPEGFYSWLTASFSVSQEWLVQNRGLDAVMYLRFLKSCTILFLILSILALIVILPTNASGPNKDLSKDDDDYVEGLYIITMSNLETGSMLLWIHVLFLTFSTFIFMVLQHRDHKLYTQLRLMYKKQVVPQNFTVLVRNISFPDDGSSTNFQTLRQKSNYLKNYLNTMFDNSVLFVRIVWNADDLVALKEEEDQNQRALERTRAIAVKSGPAAVDRSETVGNYTKELQRIRNQIIQKQKDNEPYLYPIAFVTFNSISKALLCAQTNISQDPDTFQTFQASDPRSVVWSNLKIGDKERYTRSLIIYVATFFLTFFYMIPVTFVQSLSNLRDLAQTTGWKDLETFLDDNPGFESFFRGYVPPLILLFFMIILLPVMRFMSTQQGYATSGEIERSTLNKYYFFLVFEVFLATTISGSVFKSLEGLIDDPGSVVSLFATSLPQQGLFFITYVMLSSSQTFVRLLNPGRLILIWLKQRFLCASEREFREAEAPDEFDYVEEFSNDLVIMQISLTYSVMSPIILVFAAVYFIFGTITARYRLLYVCEPKYEMAGILWPNAFTYMSVGILITNITMLGVLSLYEFPGSVICLILIYSTILFTVHVLSLYYKVSEFGAIDELNFTVSQDIPDTHMDEQKDQEGVPEHEALPLVPREIMSVERLNQESDLIKLWYAYVQPALIPSGVTPLPPLRLNRRAVVMED